MKLRFCTQIDISWCKFSVFALEITWSSSNKWNKRCSSTVHKGKVSVRAGLHWMTLQMGFTCNRCFFNVNLRSVLSRYNHLLCVQTDDGWCGRWYNVKVWHLLLSGSSSNPWKSLCRLWLLVVKWQRGAQNDLRTKTRMHSNRMRTVRCSGHLGRGGGYLPRGMSGLPRGWQSTIGRSLPSPKSLG